MVQVWSIEVKEQGACALWALAGQTKTQQKDIAERVGISQLIEILLLSSEKLQYVGEYIGIKTLAHIHKTF